MILYSSVMQKEIVAAIILAVIIIGALVAWFFVIPGEEETIGPIEIGDCVEVNYIGRYASNNTVFDSSYDDVETKSGGTPLKAFVSLDPLEAPPDEYYDYIFTIEGFTEGLIGLEKGESATIGPIPPEKAYGILPKIGDTINISDESTGQEFHLEVIDIIENSPVPEEYQDYIFGNTTLYILRDCSYHVGQEVTFYASWENATVITKINDTMIWLETNPPEDKINNFTWMDVPDMYTMITYCEGASSAVINDTTIVVTHNPKIGQKIQYDYIYGSLEFIVVSLTSDKINVSYEYNGEIGYQELDRTITLERNQTQNITYSLPTSEMENLLDSLKITDPTIPYGVGSLAGETLLFEVEIVEVHKTSQN